MTRDRHILFLVASVTVFAIALRYPPFEVAACTGIGVQGAQPVNDTILKLVEAGPFPDPDFDTLWRAWPAFPLLFTSWWAVAIRKPVVAGLCATCALACIVWYFRADRVLCVQLGEDIGPYYAAVKDYGSGYLLFLLAIVLSMCSPVYCEKG